MMKSVRLIVFSLSFAAFAACTVTPETRPHNPPTNAAQSVPQPTAAMLNPAAAVEVVAEPVQLAAGAPGEALIRLKIVPPFHINANPPSEKNLIPTELIFAIPKDLQIKKPIYPPGESKKFAFSEKPLTVYEGETTIRLPLAVSQNFPKRNFNQPLTLRFQPCDNEVCYKPQSVNFDLAVEIK